MNIFMVCATLIFCGLALTAPETELINLINKEREVHGAPPLAVNWETARLARYKSEEMRGLGFFGHNSPVYGDALEMLARFNFHFASAGVNIAKGQDTAEEVLLAWLSSDGHRENLLNAAYTSAGVGLCLDEDIAYWTLILLD